MPNIDRKLCAIGLVVLLGVVTGCREKMTLEGEAFIVTQGRENVKLGLMEVYAYKPNTIKKHLIQRHKVSVDSLINVAPEVSLILDSLSYASERFNRVTSKEVEGMGIEELNRYEEKFMSSAKLMGDVTDLAEKSLELSLGYRTQSFYLKKLPEPYSKTKTNSDGKFSMDIWGSEDYFIAAQAEREVSDSTEKYYWMEKVNLQNLEDNRIMLSNDNLDGVAENSKALTTEETEFVKDILLKLSKKEQEIDMEDAIYELSFPRDSVNVLPDSVRRDAPEGYI